VAELFDFENGASTHKAVYPVSQAQSICTTRYEGRAHELIHYRWLQSPRVELWTGPKEDPSSIKYLFPSDFLRQRSRPFRDLLDKPETIEPVDTSTTLPRQHLLLSETNAETLASFLIWSHSPNPEIDELADFRNVVRLGIFAWRYHVHALSNQATDVIRENLASGAWKLEAAIVDEVYAATSQNATEKKGEEENGPEIKSEESRLRQLTRAALNQVPRAIISGGGSEESPTDEQKAWKAARRHPELGWDLFEAADRAWSPEEFLNGVCRFHVHEDSEGFARLTADEETECPYAKDECYIEVVEPDNVTGVFQEVDGGEEQKVLSNDEVLEVSMPTNLQRFQARLWKKKQLTQSRLFQKHPLNQFHK
jgi:hypothetical protein